MTGNELMNFYPLSAEKIREWFLNEMIESFKNETVPEEFKEMMRQTGISIEHVAKLIDINPRILFDVFDNNEIYVEISRDNGCFGSTVYSSQPSCFISDFKTRKIAELFAVEEAFEILEGQLSPIELPSLKGE